MQTETVELNGHPFFLRRWGDPSKPILLMLHGFPEFGGAWGDLAPHLTGRFHCVAPDQRGYGQSWSPKGVDHYRIQHLCSDIAALIDHLGGRVTLMGHDWGASVAYGVAFAYPDKIDRLIIANGVHPLLFQREVAKGGAQSAASQYFHNLRAEGADQVFSANGYAKLLKFSTNSPHGWVPPAQQPAYIEAWSQGGGRLDTMMNWYRATPIRVADPGQPITDLPEYPREHFTVRCPHLLIWGDGDTALLPETTEGLEDYAPDLTRVSVAGTDHWLCHQKPEIVAQHILNWMPETSE